MSSNKYFRYLGHYVIIVMYIVSACLYGSIVVVEEWPCLEILRGASIHVARERIARLTHWVCTGRVLANKLWNVGIYFPRMCVVKVPI